jgi:hypothetical protein
VTRISTPLCWYKKLLFFLLTPVQQQFEESRFISSLLDFAGQALFGEF